MTPVVTLGNRARTEADATNRRLFPGPIVGP
jgi:hypothetical protein